MRQRAAAGGRTAYDRALAQPRFFRLLRDAYDGSDDLLDALFWLEHPMQPGPSGAGSPEAELAAARRALYAKAVSAEDHDRYRAAGARVTVARSAIVAALARVAPDDPAIARATTDPSTVSSGASTDAVRGVRMVGRPEHVFRRSDRRPRLAPLLRVPRATLYAVDSVLDEVCVLLVADEDSREFRGEAVSAATFGRQGITLELDDELAVAVGLSRAEWLPTGELCWWSAEDQDTD